MTVPLRVIPWTIDCSIVFTLFAFAYGFGGFARSFLGDSSLPFSTHCQGEAMQVPFALDRVLTRLGLYLTSLWTCTVSHGHSVIIQPRRCSYRRFVQTDVIMFYLPSTL